jgi:hypothetical protein
LIIPMDPNSLVDARIARCKSRSLARYDESINNRSCRGRLPVFKP